MSTQSIRAKILVIDDQAPVRRLVTRFLGTKGYQVLEASDGEMGRDMAVVNLPDLVITDLRMPRMDGLSLVRALREHPEMSGTPILVMSALEDNGTMIAALEAGASDYVTKPLVFEVLHARIAAQLRFKQLHDELKRQRRESELLFDTLHEVTESASLGEILFRITQRLGLMMTASRCSIIAVNERRGIGTITASMEDAKARGLQLDLARYPEVLQAVRTLQPVLIDDRSETALRSELGEVFRVKQVASILAVPVVFRGQVLGVLTMHVRTGEPTLNEHHVRFVNMVACAIGGMVHTAHRLETLATAHVSRFEPPRIGAAA